MKTNFLAYTLLVLISAVAFTGCKEEGPTEQTLSFHLHTLVGNNAAAYGTEFQTSSGRKFTLNDFRYYISNIVLIKGDGSELPVSGKILLASPAVSEYELGIVPTGSYKGFKFILGLDSVTNHVDPTVYSAENPLAIQSPGIHWDWNSGYIFMKVEGYVDTTAAANGPLDFEFFYHVGMDGFERTIDFSNSAFTVSDDPYEIGLEFDLLEALNNVDMRTENITHTMNDMPLAMKIADNWQGAFSVE